MSPTDKAIHKALERIKKDLDHAMDMDDPDRIHHDVVIALRRIEAQIEMLETGLHQVGNTTP